MIREFSPLNHNLRPFHDIETNPKTSALSDFVLLKKLVFFVQFCNTTGRKLPTIISPPPQTKMKFPLKNKIRMRILMKHLLIQD